MSTPIDLGRSVSGDVVELILQDHRLTEEELTTLNPAHDEGED